MKTQFIAMVATVFAFFVLSASAQSASSMFDEPAAPVDVNIAADQSRSSQTTIGVDGGTLSVTGSDGSHYILTVPAGSLNEDTAITMTPIASLVAEGIAETRFPGVILEPDGLAFGVPAQLRISRPGLSGAGVTGAVTGFSDGSDLISAVYTESGDDFIIPVPHFTIFRIDGDALVNAVRRGRSPDLARRLTNAIAAELNKNPTESLSERSRRLHEAYVLDLVDQYGRKLQEAILAGIRNPSASCGPLSKSLNAVYDLRMALAPIDPATGKPDYSRIPEWADGLSKTAGDFARPIKAACRLEAERKCRATFDTIPIRDQARAEIVLEGSDPDEVRGWHQSAVKRCGSFTVTIETRQDGIHVDAAHCTQPIAIDLKATIYVQRQGAAWPSGQAMASSTRYEHTLHCGPDDTTHALAIRGLKPMRVDLELPTPSRPNIIVHLDPGNVQMNFDVVGSAHSHDQWWLENFKAHMVHYGADSPYKLPMPAVEDGDIQKTFSGSGGYTDDTGTWNGNEFVTITIKRNF